MAEVLQPDSNLFDEHGAISLDLHCRLCGYNLRGLQSDGRCPECGTPVGRSTYGDLLRYSDPNWLAKLGRGANLVLWGILIAILSGIGGGIIGAASGAHPIGSLIGFAGGIITWIGTWLLTEPDPSTIGEDVYGLARRIVRITLFVAVASQMLAVLLEVAVLPPPVVLLLTLAIMAAQLVGVVGMFYQLVYLEKLADRVPDESLARRSRGLRRFLVIMLPLLIVFVAGLAITAAGAGTQPSPTQESVMMVFGCGAMLMMLAGLVAFLLYVRLIYRFRQAFRKVALEAPTIGQSE